MGRWFETWIGVTGLARDEVLIEVEPSVVFQMTDDP
jgi:hypothetical protein